MASFNPTSTSGIGFKLEHYVQASFVASLLLQTPVPFGSGLLVSELNFQAKHVANTDDLIVNFVGNSRYLVQSKKGFEINTNEVFDEVMNFLWKDFNNAGFDKQNHRFIITTDLLSKADAENGLLVLEWARFSKDESEFLAKIQSNKEKHAKYRYFQTAIQKANGTVPSDLLIWEFLKTIHIKVYDYLQLGSKDREMLKWFLQPYLKTGITAEHALLKIIEYAWTCNQYGASLTLANVNNRIKELFDLTKSPALGTDLAELIKKSKSQVQHAIHNDIDGFHIDRAPYLMELSQSLADKPFVVVSGEGGSGKSGLVKEYIERCSASQGSYLVFKGDQLDRQSLATALAEIGMSSDFETILSQWQLLPRLIIYIDSFEKLYESEHKEAMLELLGKVREANAGVRIIATCRNFAIETLRIKYRIPKEDIGIVELEPLSEEQLSEVACSRPKLRNAISNRKLRKLIALPFYLNVANQIADSISGEAEMDETAFKKALWEHIIEKKGAGKTGDGKKRAFAFSQIALLRAKEKLAYVEPEATIDQAALGNLEQEGLLLKHAKLDAYSPAHDIFEDMVVINFLNHLFHTKTNNEGFLGSIDSNPVFRRALRQWIQELIIEYPSEAKLFLSEAFMLHESSSIVDEMLIGILGSSEAYSLIKQNAELFLNDNLKLFFKAFRLLKVAYTEPYKGKHPERKTKTKGPGWAALLKIMEDNFHSHKGLAIVVDDLLYHWTLQYEEDEALPEEAAVAARLSLELLEAGKSGYKFEPQRKVLERLFFVAPFAKEPVEKLIRETIGSRKLPDKTDWIARSFHDGLCKMVLVETFRCTKLYKLFPELVIELARMEWYRDGTPIEEYDHNYLEASFGLVEYPYKYFSASAYQTPFEYLFRYHPQTALAFLIELCNRSVQSYLRSPYAGQAGTSLLSIELPNGSKVSLYGDVNLWGIYRGMGSSPYLLQSALMAFEQYLLQEAENDSIPDTFLEHVMQQSNSVLLIGVLSSVAMAHPFAFQEKVLAILCKREFFAWDLSRYSQELGNLHTSIGNEPYYTSERHVSNKLKHRQTSLEHLVSKLQFYYPQPICNLIDGFKMAVHKDDLPWQLALARMDMRNTVPEKSEDEHIIIFKPNPLPEELQEYIDEGKEEREQDSSTISTFLWSQKAFKQEDGILATYDVWKGHYDKLRASGPTRPGSIVDPSKKMAAVGIKFLSADLTGEEMAYCSETILLDAEEMLAQLKLGHTHSALDIMNNDIFGVLPLLIRPVPVAPTQAEQAKAQISDFLLLLPEDAKKHLIGGIQQYVWAIDAPFAEKCFQLLLKSAKYQLYPKMSRLRGLTAKAFTEAVDKLLEEARSGQDTQAKDIDLNGGNPMFILSALQSVPYPLLNSSHRIYLQELLTKVSEIADIEDYNKHELVEGLQYLFARYLSNNADSNSANMLWSLLSLKDTQFRFVMDTLKKFVWVGHDSGYPAQFWFHINALVKYVFEESPTVGFINVVLMEPLQHVYQANKLQENGPGRKLHENFISHFANDKNLVEAVFKLLAGVGSTYQPICLTWLMKSIPTREAYMECLSTVSSISYIDEFVNQLYTNYIQHIRMNRDQMDYMIMLLGILIDKGSTEAFRIRDELI